MGQIGTVRKRGAAFIRRNPVLSFLVINYAISWTFLYPSYRLIQINNGITPLALVGLIGAYGPTIAAIVVQYVIAKDRLKELFRKLIKVKNGFPVYAFVVMAPLLFYLIAWLISAYIWDGPDEARYPLDLLADILFPLLIALPFGPMGEELGWRGFMLPKLLEKNSAVKSSLMVGLAWGIWHLVSFTFPGAALPSIFSVNIWTILLYFANTIALSFAFTWVHLRSGGSVFLAILLHAFFNIAGSTIEGVFVVYDLAPDEITTLTIQTAYIVNAAVALVIGYLFLKISGRTK